MTQNDGGPDPLANAEAAITGRTLAGTPVTGGGTTEWLS